MALERQLTFGKYGHMLNRRQAISPDGQWAVYDTRNDDAHIARTDAIELVHLDSGEIVSLFRTPRSSIHGPGVGAAAFHPNEDQVVFIHGLESCSSENPYSAARRFGALVQVELPGKYTHAEARAGHNLVGSRVRGDGMLSGGTHAHSWNHDGWLSFTYNDAWLERTARIDNRIRDLRTVGFMRPGPCASVDGNQAESFDGTFQAFLAANVCNDARHGSDDIEQAVEECWIGKKGYTDHQGVHRSKALAFQGAVRNDSGELIREIFVSDLDNQENPQDAILPREISSRELLEPARSCKQRRLTHTFSRTYPGVQGIRNWLVSSPDGKHIYAPMRDENGIVQLHRIETSNGSIDQITDWEHSMEGQISLNAQGTVCSNICDQRVCLTHVATGKSVWVTNRMEHQLSGAVHFVGEHRIVFNRIVGDKSNEYIQVFVCEL